MNTGQSDTMKERHWAKQAYMQISIDYSLWAQYAIKHKKKKMVFLRGRKINETKLDITSKETFGLPPSNVVKSRGRANIAYHPVLYVGQTPEIITNEIDISIDDVFYLEIYANKLPVDFNYISFLNKNIPKENKWLGHHNRFLDEVKNKYSDKFSKIDESLEAVSKLFTESNYDITAPIAHEWLYNRNIDAILYPSNPNPIYCNFAISPRFYEDHLFIYKIHNVKLKSNGYIEFIKTGDIDSQGIIWRETTRTDHHEFNSAYKHLCV